MLRFSTSRSRPSYNCSVHPSGDSRLPQSDRLILSVLVLAAVVLGLAEYLLIPIRFESVFPGALARWAPGVWYGSAEAALAADARGTWWGPLLPFVWWSGGLVVLWILLPGLLARRWSFSWRDLGCRIGALGSKLPIYALLFLPVGIAVLWASRQDSFLESYPMLRPEQVIDWSWLLLLSYWALYALQFVCVEFFFRGYLLFTLEGRLGRAAIGVSVVPYSMIHYHKPLPEALAAIVAGCVLGWLALETRSLWGGVLLHVAVALSMDVAALSVTGVGFPDHFLP